LINRITFAECLLLLLLLSSSLCGLLLSPITLSLCMPLRNEGGSGEFPPRILNYCLCRDSKTGS
jgi:hypothetical protein